MTCKDKIEEAIAKAHKEGYQEAVNDILNLLDNKEDIKKISKLA